MISRSHRLSVKQFGVVMKKGRVAHSPLFLFRILAAQEGVRIAAVAPQKSYPTAVARNYVRRKIYNSIRDVVDTLKSVDIIIIAKQGADQASVEEIKSEALDIFVKSGLVR